MRKKIFISTLIITLAVVFVVILTRAAEQRFVDNEDGTVTDTQTGLMWSKTSSPGDLTWQDAEAYCKVPAIAEYKYTDWRMPTIEELKTLYMKDVEGYETDCGLKAWVDPIFELTCTWIWSSDLPETPQFSKKGKTRRVRSVMAYVFDLGRGYKYADRMVHKKNLRALPVRGTMKETKETK
jgi:hypothetical protein